MKHEIINVHLSGIKQQARVLDGIVIPESLIAQTIPWMPLLYKIQKIVGDRVLVTSVLSSFNGEARSGSSHPNGWAIDITFPDRIASGVNPHFENDIYLMTYLASRLTGPIALAFESDHVHIELSNSLKGVYRYPTSRPQHYHNDKLPSPRIIPDEQLWSVKVNSISLDPNANSALMKQRQATNARLPDEVRNAMIAQVNV